MKALDTVRKDWRQLKEGPPGRRFRAFHDARRKRRENESSTERALIMSGGIALILAGLAIGWLPGPGGFIGIFGVAILATEIRSLAVVADGIERRLRQVARWTHVHWKRSSTALKIMSVLAATAVLAGAAYFAATR